MPNSGNSNLNFGGQAGLNQNILNTALNAAPVFQPMMFKKGGKVSPDKAKQILKDNKVRGKDLSSKQRRFFAAQAFANGGVLDRALSEYIITNRDRGGLKDKVYDKYVIPVEQNKAAVINTSNSSADVGNVSAPTRIDSLLEMIARPETGGLKNPYSVVNKAGFAGKWQVGRELMQQFGIDRNRFI